MRLYNKISYLKATDLPEITELCALRPIMQKIADYVQSWA